MSETPPQTLLNLFDPAWYLSYYPDLAAANVDPITHYKNYGWREGRWPCFIEAVDLDGNLWANKISEQPLARLKEIASTESDPHRGLAAWFVCRWLASLAEWERASAYVDIMLQDDEFAKYISHDGPYLLAFSILFNCNQLNAALKLLSCERWQDSADKKLAASMLYNGDEKIKAINQIYSQNNLLEIGLVRQPGLDKISAVNGKYRAKLSRFSPSVSVIIPCFNAEQTITTAVRSLLRQTYSKLEIIVVDDASTDDTASIVKGMSLEDSRIKYHRMPCNGGAYAARNAGLKMSKGRLITIHDADDWSHPQKIEKQVAMLQQNRRIKATVSHWVRSTPTMLFERWRMEEGWIYRNVSSLMFKRSVFRKLGFWDTVSVNADTEYYLRIQQKFGPTSIKEVMPGIPLSFGRVDEGSLTQTSATHLRTQFAGIRKDYMDAAVAWQRNAKRLYMPQHGLRKFPAPPLICRGTTEARKDNLKRVLESKGLFDKAWYLAAYPDIAKAGAEPLTHFINHGLEEGRDPNPYLSVSGLAYISGKSNFDAISRWTSETIDKSTLYSIDGSAPPKNGKQILMVAHLAGSELFGAERSFLDCVRMLYGQKADITVVLPSGVNRAYIAEIARFANKIYFTPLPWWHQGRQKIAEVTEQIRLIIKASDASVVYVNTLTLWEPHLAARQCEVKSVMHVRELPNHDRDLCNRLNATPEQIRQHIDACSDFVIANSGVTASFVNLKEKTSVIYNAIDTLEFLHPSDKSVSSTLNVVMLSSNTIKKGITDFFSLARAVAHETDQISFFIYGPESPKLTTEFAHNQSSNVSFCGYASAPFEAYRNMDIVLNLSQFQESFGRTIIEGMAAGCVPIGYKWGALEEIIDPAAGYLVPFGDVQSIAQILLALQNDKEKLANMKANAQKIANERFEETVISKKLIEAF